MTAVIHALRAGDSPEVGPYRLVGRLGGGGMGEVFLGRSRGGLPVAVKVVRPDLAGDAEFRRRFAQEVEAARKVGGFYTAQVIDADTSAARPWLATAYIPGPSLEEAVSRHGPLPVASVAVLGAGLAEGLAAVHACGLVHRDLKPGNVILAEGGPRLIDFGIVRALDRVSQTHSRMVVGTPAFMSPEQARGHAVGPPSDVFALGSVLAYAATGRSPFGTGHGEALGFRIVHEQPDLSGIPDDLAGLITACLDKEPAGRPGVSAVIDRLAGPAADAPWWLPLDVTRMITERETAILTPPPATSRTPTEPRAPARRRRPPWQATGAALVTLSLLALAVGGLGDGFDSVLRAVDGTPFEEVFDESPGLRDEGVTVVVVLTVLTLLSCCCVLGALTAKVTGRAVAPVARVIGSTLRTTVVTAACLAGLAAPPFAWTGLTSLLGEWMSPMTALWVALAAVAVALVIALGWNAEASKAGEAETVEAGGARR
ncbi:serine/threonine-protein kinase [Nonomuraea rhodomycinica]|uniref:serine/threonine-protein kinase n=1 Tax=Nonomuraea rhodomycinica TaxID=1712872 RepID=UPI001C37A00D|nr:serine/threonine-protein kinase [Nonomuraea rhodomycinica]